MNEQIQNNNLIQFKQALDSLDKAITIKKLKRFQFDNSENLISAIMTDIEENIQKKKSTLSLFGKSNIKQGNVSNPFKLKLLCGVKKCK